MTALAPLRSDRVGQPRPGGGSRIRERPLARIYGGERDIQRGPFVQVTLDRVTIGGYWFNPGSSDQIFVGSIGVTF